MEDQKNDDQSLELLRDEGLEVLSLFRKIREKKKRQLVIDLMQAIIETQAATNGGSGEPH